MAGVFAWTKGFLDATGHLDVLRSYLPSFRCVLADGTRVLAVHASYVADDRPGIATHDPTDRMLDAMRLVNPESVGNPPTGDKSAKYCILDGGPELTVTHRAVAYDLERVRAQIEGSGYPGARYLLYRHYT